jgi:hypothetical protein
LDSSTRFLQALERARAKRGDSAEPISVHVSRGGAELDVDITDADRLGVLTTAIKVTRKSAPSGDEAALVGQSNELIRRVTYLQESFALIELERARSRAVLRSANPQVDGDSIQYYEAVLEGGRSATIKRYRFERTGRTRRVVPANLSTETAGRLGGDLLDLFATK